MSDPKTVTPSLRTWIASAEKNNGQLPDAKKLALWTRVSEGEAGKALEEYKRAKSKPLPPPAPKVEPVQDRKVETVPPPVQKFSIRKALDFLLDGGALIVAMVVDIVMNVVGFSILAYDDASRIGFIASAFVVVIFALRAWLKGGWYGKVLWFTFALVATFLDVSLSVASSHQQSTIVVYDATKDEVLIALKEKAKNDEAYLESLRAKQIEKGEGYKSQIELAVDQSNKSSEAVRNYHPGQESAVRGLSSSDIFTAIPDAALSNDPARQIGLAFFLVFFIGLQLTIVSSATASVERIKAGS